MVTVHQDQISPISPIFGNFFNLIHSRNLNLTKSSHRSESRQRSSYPLQMKSRDKATMPGLKLLQMLERRTSFIFMRFTTIYDYWINSTPIRQAGQQQHCPITVWTVKLLTLGFDTFMWLWMIKYLHVIYKDGQKSAAKVAIFSSPIMPKATCKIHNGMGCRLYLPLSIVQS